MGSLHEGHLSLLAAAGAECDVVAMSIFVNPLQFSSAEDLARYPADLEADLELAERAGVGLVFAPSAGEMYPRGEPQTTVDPGPLAARLEGVVPPRALRRGRDGRHQADLALRPVPGLLRGEGLPAAGHRAQPGRRP